MLSLTSLAPPPSPRSHCTYLSTDGGVTWSDVGEGSFIYEFADFGSTIVMAKHPGLRGLPASEWEVVGCGGWMGGEGQLEMGRGRLLWMGCMLVAETEEPEASSLSQLSSDPSLSPSIPAPSPPPPPCSRGPHQHRLRQVLANPPALDRLLCRQHPVSPRNSPRRNWRRKSPRAAQMQPFVLRLLR